MITYGVSTIFYMSSSLLVFKTADLVIGSLISSAAVSRFYIATTPALLLATFIQVFAQAMKPAVSDLDARDEHGRIEEMAILSQKYTLMAIIPGVTFLVLMGESFLRVWVGDRFPDPSSIAELAIVLQVLAIGSGLRLSQHTNFIVLVGKGNHRIFGMTALGMWLTSAALSIASVRYFGAGLTGIAWACAIPMAVVSITILPRHFIHAMEISLVRTIRGSWAPALYSTAPALIVLYAWSRLAPPDSWLTILAAVFGAAGLTVICGWFVGVTPSERAMLRRALPF
jgi:O-antigen/teichoic acid export membrane protein